MSALPRLRRSARAILLDERGRALLVRFVVSREDGDFTFWATPGGEVESGEDALGAARREVAEELGLALELAGPVHEARGRFEHEGVLVDNTDLFFVGRCDALRPVIGGRSRAERDAMRELRWWSADELDATIEAVFPPGLGALVRRCLKDFDRGPRARA